MTAPASGHERQDCAAIRAYLDAKYPNSLTERDEKAQRLYYMECAELYAAHALDLEAREAALREQGPVAWQIVGKDRAFARYGFTYEHSPDLVIDADARWPANAPHRCIPLYAAPVAAQPDMEWVSVKERLPDEGETVMAFWNTRYEVSPACWGVTTYLRGHWLNVDDRNDQYDTPQFWCALPSAPVAKEWK